MLRIFSRENKPGNMKIYLSNNRIFSNSQKAINLENSKKLGEKNEGKIIYSPYEGIFLTETENPEIYLDEKLISSAKFIKLLSKKNPELMTNYLVFKDLRKKGYILKTGSKFGTEFRVYKKSEKHAKWILFIISENEKMNTKDFIAKNRIAHSIAKKLLIAIVDSQENITYFETDWLKIK